MMVGFPTALKLPRRSTRIWYAIEDQVPPKEAETMSSTCSRIDDNDPISPSSSGSTSEASQYINLELRISTWMLAIVVALFAGKRAKIALAAATQNDVLVSVVSTTSVSFAFDFSCRGPKKSRF